MDYFCSERVARHSSGDDCLPGRHRTTHFLPAKEALPGNLRLQFPTFSLICGESELLPFLPNLGFGGSLAKA